MMRRSRHLADAVLLLLIFGVQNVSTRNVPVKRGSGLESECYTFVGKVDCQNGGRILSSAKVSVMKYDYISSDDKLSTAQVYEEGFYKIHGCVDDAGFLGNGINGNVELFLEFENVCFDGQRYYVSNPVPDKFESHLLGEEENNDIGSGVEANNDEKRLTVANHPMPRSQPPKYTPMPRLRRQQQGQYDLMNMDAGKMRSKRYTYDCQNDYVLLIRGEYTFKGKITCDGHTIRPGAEVAVWESNFFDMHSNLATSTINENGEYEFNVFARDTVVLHWFNWVAQVIAHHDTAQIYLYFQNICADGDAYKFACPQPNFSQNLIVENGKIQESYGSG